MRWDSHDLGFQLINNIFNVSTMNVSIYGEVTNFLRLDMNPTASKMRKKL